MRNRLASLILTPLLLLSSISASASSYYVMVPLPGKTTTGQPGNPGSPGEEVDPENIELQLSATSTFMPQQKYNYVFDMKSLLSVTGDPTYDGSGVSFNYSTPMFPPTGGWPQPVAGFPGGITVTNDGLLSGRANVADGTLYQFNVSATYKGKTAEQTYQVTVQNAPQLSWNSPGLQVAITPGTPVDFNLRQHVFVQDSVELGGIDFENKAQVSFDSGSLPFGLWIDPAGHLVGVLNSPPGQYPVTTTMRYRDEMTLASFTLNVKGTIVVDLPSRIVLPSGRAGAPYYQSVEQYLTVTGESPGGFPTANWRFAVPSPIFAMADYGYIYPSGELVAGMYELPAQVIYTANDGSIYVRDTVIEIEVQDDPGPI